MGDDEERVTLHVKTQDLRIKSSREEACKRVRDYFEQYVPIPTEIKVLCFFDDEDVPSLKRDPPSGPGPDNRGFHLPVKGDIGDLPDYVQELLAVENPDSFELRWPFASLIYLHGSSCENEIGMSLTFAHELQHFVQYATSRRVWAANTLLMNLERHFPNQTEFNFLWEIPVEVEARIIAKQVGESIYGTERIAEHVENKINQPISANDAKDWQFFRNLQSLASYDLLAETKPLVQKYKALLQQLQNHHNFKGDQDFATIDFDKPNWWE